MQTISTRPVGTDSIVPMTASVVGPERDETDGLIGDCPRYAVSSARSGYNRNFIWGMILLVFVGSIGCLVTVRGYRTNVHHDITISIDGEKMDISNCGAENTETYPNNPGRYVTVDEQVVVNRMFNTETTVLTIDQPFLRSCVEPRMCPCYLWNSNVPGLAFFRMGYNGGLGLYVNHTSCKSFGNGSYVQDFSLTGHYSFYAKVCGYMTNVLRYILLTFGGVSSEQYHFDSGTKFDDSIAIMAYGPRYVVTTTSRRIIIIWYSYIKFDHCYSTFSHYGDFGIPNLR